MTIDEVVLAGIVRYNEPSGENNYLNTNELWWLMSPYRYDGRMYAYDSIAYGDKWGYSEYITFPYGVRPSASLSSSVVIVGGDGSSNSPYRVSMPVNEEENKPGTAFVGLEPDTTYYLREVRAPS